MGEERDDLRSVGSGRSDRAPLRNASPRDLLRGVHLRDHVPVAAAVVLRAVWAKGWVVPDEPDLPPLPVTEVSPPQPLTGGGRAWRILRWTIGLGSLLLFAYGPVNAKAVVLALGAIVLPWWFFRVYLDR
ncbi:MAG: hypothetical protein E6G58_10300 [Actinobacteria bacterium]|nr:MAG: hypothetical protein E6G58_10300 [Actinomycetota bacterium]